MAGLSGIISKIGKLFAAHYVGSRRSPSAAHRARVRARGGFETPVARDWTPPSRAGETPPPKSPRKKPAPSHSRPGESSSSSLPEAVQSFRDSVDRELSELAREVEKLTRSIDSALSDQSSEIVTSLKSLGLDRRSGQRKPPRTTRRAAEEIVEQQTPRPDSEGDRGGGLGAAAGGFFTWKALKTLLKRGLGRGAAMAGEVGEGAALGVEGGPLGMAIGAVGAIVLGSMMDGESSGLPSASDDVKGILGSLFGEKTHGSKTMTFAAQKIIFEGKISGLPVIGEGGGEATSPKSPFAPAEGAGAPRPAPPGWSYGGSQMGPPGSGGGFVRRRSGSSASGGAVDFSRAKREKGKSVMSIAREELGKNEKTDRKALMEWLRTGGVNMDPETTAWCAGYANAVLQKAGIKGTGSLAARSFMSWGTATSKPQVGDVAVFSRGANQGHVGFFEGFNADHSKIKILAGNSRDSVREEWVSSSRLLGFRRAPTPEKPVEPEQAKKTPVAKITTPDKPVARGRAKDDLYVPDEPTPRPAPPHSRASDVRLPTWDVRPKPKPDPFDARRFGPPVEPKPKPLPMAPAHPPVPPKPVPPDDGREGRVGSSRGDRLPDKTSRVDPRRWGDQAAPKPDVEKVNPLRWGGVAQPDEPMSFSRYFGVGVEDN